MGTQRHQHINTKAPPLAKYLLEKADRNPSDLELQRQVLSDPRISEHLDQEDRRRIRHRIYAANRRRNKRLGKAGIAGILDFIQQHEQE